IRRISPGPLAVSSLPSRKMTPRSYSRKMRTTCGNRTDPTIKTGISHLSAFTRLVMMSMSYLLLCFFGFHFQRQSVDGDDFHGFIRRDRQLADRVPIFAIDEHFSFLTADGRQAAGCLAQHGFDADFDRQKLRAYSRSHDEHEERRGQQR